MRISARDFCLRPMVVRGLADDELYSVIAENTTEQSADNKQLIVHPEYVLNIVRRKAGSQALFRCG